MPNRMSCSTQSINASPCDNVHATYETKMSALETIHNSVVHYHRAFTQNDSSTQAVDQVLSLSLVCFRFLAVVVAVVAVVVVVVVAAAAAVPYTLPCECGARGRGAGGDKNFQFNS